MIGTDPGASARGAFLAGSAAVAPSNAWYYRMGTRIDARGRPSRPSSGLQASGVMGVGARKGRDERSCIALGARSEPSLPPGAPPTAVPVAHLRTVAYIPSHGDAMRSTGTHANGRCRRRASEGEVATGCGPGGSAANHAEDRPPDREAVRCGPAATGSREPLRT